MTLPLNLSLAANHKPEAVSNSGSVQGQPRTTPRVMFKTYEFVAHSWFLICIVRKSRSNGPSPAPCGAAPHFFSARSRSSITTRQALSRGLCSRFHTMPTTYGLRTALQNPRTCRHAVRVTEGRGKSGLFRSHSPVSHALLRACPGAGARWVAGGGRSRTA